MPEEVRKRVFSVCNKGLASAAPTRTRIKCPSPWTSSSWFDTPIATRHSAKLHDNRCFGSGSSRSLRLKLKLLFLRGGMHTDPCLVPSKFFTTRPPVRSATTCELHPLKTTNAIPAQLRLKKSASPFLVTFSTWRRLRHFRVWSTPPRSPAMSSFSRRLAGRVILSGDIGFSQLLLCLHTESYQGRPLFIAGVLVRKRSAFAPLQLRLFVSVQAKRARERTPTPGQYRGVRGPHEGETSRCFLAVCRREPSTCSLRPCLTCNLVFLFDDVEECWFVWPMIMKPRPVL
jgi:hypothetical protein